ncbi:hypothetical protein Tco_0633207 [Tanacetum coccineum]
MGTPTQYVCDYLESSGWGTPTQICVWSCPNFSAPAGRPFRCVKSKVCDWYWKKKAVTQWDWVEMDVESNYVKILTLTLWGELGDVLVEKKTKHAGVCAMVLTGMSGKDTSSTVFYDDDDIPWELRADGRTKKGGTTRYEKCRKGATQKLRKWVCEACNRTADYPVYRLEVVVADDTAHTVVMFNDTAT